MPYPNSPFLEDFNNEDLIPSTSLVENREELISDLMKWLCTTPCVTTIRINPSLQSIEEVQTIIATHLDDICKTNNRDVPKVDVHQLVKDAILIEHFNRMNVFATDNEIIVDPQCGAAILRGAHLFAPGVIGMTKDCKVGDTVSIYIDISIKNKCKKGFAKVFESSNKVLIANGIVKLGRNELFGCVPQSGIAVEITASISGAPTIDQNLLLQYGAILQNLPSMITVQCLEVKPHDVILDMCASPGGKTSHIANLAHNGIVIAIDKTTKKVDTLRKTLSTLQCHNCRCFVADSTNLLREKQIEGASVDLGPPFERNSFDKILLDAPCSATGQRPQFVNKSSSVVLKSYVALQRKLIENAVNLLKTKGTMVYSTCSIMMPENEGIVAWALKKFPLQLVPSQPNLTRGGLPHEGIEHPEYLHRFGPQDDTDSIGFFIAKFEKRENCL